MRDGPVYIGRRTFGQAGILGCSDDADDLNRLVGFALKARSVCQSHPDLAKRLGERGIYDCHGVILADPGKSLPRKKGMPIVSK